ncbi:geraniol 8-hydroxylase [Gossypium hirsutum]|uniref:Geraniol 8-hydroxylase n=1 Tax=Gossypium hirsutum TaxID=3635 RepID=A0A1U8ILA2_GOSHI|nr:geraniol 8-hydroxylase-like [Gossypium hirsutum]
MDTLINVVEDGIEELNKTHVTNLLLDLFVAGTDTTSSTLEWAMPELLRNPQALLKAKKELDEAIGKGNPVEESDINRLPYLQAIIKETFRMHPAVPLLLPRRADSDANLCGFKIPKGSQVLINVWAIGRDPSIWDNPNSFILDRFLGSEIDVKGRDFGLIPFGAGRRICPGLPLANRMLHLMLGSLINYFDWKLEGEISPNEMNMEEKYRIAVHMATPLRAIPLLV